MTISDNKPDRILRLKDVNQRTGLSRSSIYDRMKYSDFPRRISLGGRTVGWRESEIDAWVSSRQQKH